MLVVRGSLLLTELFAGAPYKQSTHLMGKFGTTLSETHGDINKKNLFLTQHMSQSRQTVASEGPGWVGGVYISKYKLGFDKFGNFC